MVTCIYEKSIDEMFTGAQNCQLTFEKLQALANDLLLPGTLDIYTVLRKSLTKPILFMLTF